MVRRPTRPEQSGRATQFDRARKLILEGRLKEAEELASLALPGLPETRHYLPLGDLLLMFKGQDEPCMEYSRELDLERGTVTVRYRIGDIMYTREVLSSYPDQALVIRLSADKIGAISFKARFNRGRWRYLEDREMGRRRTGHDRT